MINYTKDHEWIRFDGGVATVGITDHAQSQLGDVVFVELPKVGQTFKAGEQFAVVESVKAASEVYAPIAGKVVEINGELEGTPALVNESAEDKGWFARFTLEDGAPTEGLMDKAAYDALVGA